MQNTTKIILATALAAAGFGYFQVVAAGDARGTTLSVALIQETAATMRMATERPASPFIVREQR